MKSKFIKTGLASLILSVSGFANAGLITHNNYTLDTNTNIVSSGATEWLQWDETVGESITSASASYAADGWVVADNTRMASLFTDFGWSYGPVTSANYITQSAYTEDDTALMDNFIALFGPTRESTHFTIGTGVNNLVSTTAFFIDAGDAGSRYATISSDYTHLGNKIDYSAVVIGDNGQFDISSTHTLFGVALYRNAETIASANTVTVPAPSTFAIFALGMIGLASRRFKKKS